MAASARFHQVNPAIRPSTPPLAYLASAWNYDVNDPSNGDLAYLGNDHFAVIGESDTVATAATVGIFKRDPIARTLTQSKQIINLPVELFSGNYYQLKGITFNGNHLVVIRYYFNQLLGTETTQFVGYDLNGNEKWATADIGNSIVNGLCYDGNHYYTTGFHAKVGSFIYQVNIFDGELQNSPRVYTPTTATTTRYNICWDGRRLWIIYTTSARVGHSIIMAQFQRTGGNNQWPISVLVSGITNVPMGLEYDGRQFSWLYKY